MQNKDGSAGRRHGKAQEPSPQDILAGTSWLKPWGRSKCDCQHVWGSRPRKPMMWGGAVSVVIFYDIRVEGIFPGSRIQLLSYT